MAQWHKRMAVIPTVVVLILIWRNEIFNIFTSYTLVTKQSVALRSAYQHAKKIDERWGRECLTARLFLPILLYACVTYVVLPIIISYLFSDVL